MKPENHIEISIILASESFSSVGFNIKREKRKSIKSMKKSMTIDNVRI